MRLYLMRHAEAVEPGDWRGPDRTRPLTPLGAAKLSSAVEHMRRSKLSADVLLTSPYVRATQTADLHVKPPLCSTSCSRTGWKCSHSPTTGDAPVTGDAGASKEELRLTV